MLISRVLKITDLDMSPRSDDITWNDVHHGILFDRRPADTIIFENCPTMKLTDMENANKSKYYDKFHVLTEIKVIKTNLISRECDT